MLNSLAVVDVAVGARLIDHESALVIAVIVAAPIWVPL